MVAQRFAKPSYGNVVRVRVTAIPLGNHIARGFQNGHASGLISKESGGLINHVRR